jgi:hypothetical protein
MSEIQKMANIVEISIWDCGGFNEAGECTPMTKWSGTSNQQKISEIMNVVSQLKITPHMGSLSGTMICFKDKKGNFLCTCYGYESDKILYGTDYRDETGKLFKALESAGLWDIEATIGGKKSKITTMAEIQKMDDAKEISMWYYWEIKSSTEIEGLKKAAFTTDRQKIADIMSLVKELKIAHITDTAPESLICFEDPNNKTFCIYLGPGPRKEIYGLDYQDKTGKLYDALQSAGFPLPEPIEPNHNPSKQRF